MDLSLKNKVALVTAGSKGMGRAIAISFAKEGMRVAVSARGVEALNQTVSDVEASGTEAIAISGDVTNPQDVTSMVEQTLARFGRLDVLVVNAGGPPARPFMEATDDDWRAALDLNLLSAVRLIRAALPSLSKQGGSIITIESISVKQPVKGLVLSNSIRPGVIGLTKTLADEVGEKGVRLNNILPGMIMTDRARELAGGRAEQSGRSLEDVISETEAGIPLRRYGRPEEVANLAVFLASDASSYVTGTSILCDGGLYRGLY